MTGNAVLRCLDLPPVRHLCQLHQLVRRESAQLPVALLHPLHQPPLTGLVAQRLERRGRLEELFRGHAPELGLDKRGK